MIRSPLFRALAIGALAAAAAWWFMPAQPMPLDGEHLERFQENTSAMVKRIEQESPALPYAARQADALRRAITATGYSADLTLRRWLSASYREEIRGGDPALAMDRLRLLDSLLATAFGDGADDATFALIIADDAADIATAARKRRAGEASF